MKDRTLLPGMILALAAGVALGFGALLLAEPGHHLPAPPPFRHGSVPPSPRPPRQP